MGLPENVEPAIEPEIALLTRETTTDLASTSTGSLPKSNVDLACQIRVIIQYCHLNVRLNSYLIPVHQTGDILCISANLLIV